MEIEIFLNLAFRLVFFPAGFCLVFQSKVDKNLSDTSVVYICLIVQLMQCLTYCFWIHARKVFQFSEISAIILSDSFHDTLKMKISVKSAIAAFFFFLLSFSMTSYPTWFPSIKGCLCVASQLFYIICNIHLNSRSNGIPSGSCTVVCHGFPWDCEPCSASTYLGIFY